MPREKSPPEKIPRENCPPENYPQEIYPQENCPPKKCLSGKLPLGKLPIEKLFYSTFVAFNITLQLLIFKLFIVTSFGGVFRTPAVPIIDLLVSVVNGSN